MGVFSGRTGLLLPNFNKEIETVERDRNLRKMEHRETPKPDFSKSPYYVSKVDQGKRGEH